MFFQHISNPHKPYPLHSDHRPHRLCDHHSPAHLSRVLLCILKEGNFLLFLFIFLFFFRFLFIFLFFFRFIFCGNRSRRSESLLARPLQRNLPGKERKWPLCDWIRLKEHLFGRLPNRPLRVQVESSLQNWGPLQWEKAAALSLQVEVAYC